jgi:hypothetical protein
VDAPGLAGREALLAQLVELQHDLETRGDDWENPTLGRYLEALRALLGSIENAYANKGEAIPEDPWTIMADAMAGARYYE